MHSRRRRKMENNPRKAKAITSDSIPIDLLIEILLRLPAKSVTRFVSVSKLFATIIRSQDFTRFRSSKQKQRVLLAFSRVDKEKGHENWSFVSSSLKESSPPVFLSHMASRHAPELRHTRPSCVHGLISFVYGEEQIISNPSTGKSITLPLVKSRRRVLKRFFGYDPVDDRYKVLCVTEPMFGTGMRVAPSQCQVLTLGSSSHQNSWRQIECSIPHRPQSEGLCTNGVLYYYAYMGTEIMEPSVVRFDVRSETFDFLTNLPAEVQTCLKDSNLINYQGNVASATRTSSESFDLWVLEDFKKQQWLKVNLSTSPLGTYRTRPLDFRGIAHTGEEIYASYYLDNCYLIIHHHQMEDRKVVKIDAESVVMFSRSYKLGRLSGVLSFLDYVESVMFS